MWSNLTGPSVRLLLISSTLSAHNTTINIKYCHQTARCPYLSAQADCYACETVLIMKESFLYLKDGIGNGTIRPSPCLRRTLKRCYILSRFDSSLCSEMRWGYHRYLVLLPCALERGDGGSSNSNNNLSIHCRSKFTSLDSQIHSPAMSTMKHSTMKHRNIVVTFYRLNIVFIHMLLQPVKSYTCHVFRYSPKCFCRSWILCEWLN